VENSPWKRKWTYRKTDYGMSESFYQCSFVLIQADEISESLNIAVLCQISGSAGQKSSLALKDVRFNCDIAEASGPLACDSP
jgi:hypothetical protein